MKTKYTPGPWKVDPEPYCDGGWYIQTEDGKRCIASTPEDLPETEEVEQFANATLLAAAPELAEALNECLKALDVAFEFEGDVFGKHHNDAVDALQNARHALQSAGLVP